MADEPKWLVEWRERIQDEREAACRRDYERGIAEDKFPDTKESWKAFVYGWYGTLQFQQDKKAYENAGNDGFFMIFFLIGGMLIILPLFALVMAPGVVIAKNCIMAILGGAALVLLGRRSLSKSRHKAAEARAKFKAEWGDTKPVDA